MKRDTRQEREREREREREKERERGWRKTVDRGLVVNYVEEPVEWQHLSARKPEGCARMWNKRWRRCLLVKFPLNEGRGWSDCTWKMEWTVTRFVITSNGLRQIKGALKTEPNQPYWFLCRFGYRAWIIERLHGTIGVRWTGDNNGKRENWTLMLFREIFDLFINESENCWRGFEMKVKIVY